jgi:signal transduction histidine kinase
VNEVVERALQLIRNPFQLADIELCVAVAPELPEIVGDAGQIQQVLVALLANASDALGNGGKVTVAAFPHNGGVRLSVRDTGPGVPIEIQTAVFEPFFSTKDNKQRTGLGLAIAKDIVERHGGVLRLISEPGAGAEFLITLPLEAPAELLPVEPATEDACPRDES